MLTEMSRLFERRTLLNLISSHIWYLNKFLWLWSVSLFSVEFVFVFLVPSKLTHRSRSELSNV